MSNMLPAGLQQPLPGNFQSDHVLLAPSSESLSENAVAWTRAVRFGGMGVPGEAQQALDCEARMYLHLGAR